MKLYNRQRLALDVKSVNTLGVWGIANALTGGVGYFTAKDEEWKYFHEMNCIWGVINTGIAGFGAARVKRESKEKFSSRQAVNRYVNDKKIYVVNIALDVVYIGASAALLQYSGAHPEDNPAMYRGFGKSLLIQGAFLLVFDNVMLLSHRKNSGKWDELLDDMRVTGTMLTYTVPIGSRRHSTPDSYQHYKR